MAHDHHGEWTRPLPGVNASDGPASGTPLLAGRYQLFEQIGAGASAITWRARDTRLGRIVAIKLLRQALTEEPGYAQRFEREARLAASISHPNVVDVFDVGRQDGQLYIVMQFVEGADLKHLIEREGRLSPERAVAIARQILDGLGAIHRAGIIHRDIKPQNVLIGTDGITRVTDFGVAHIDAGDGLTSTGMAIGTAAYMAPEQAEGGTISEATDVYAAGAVLYEMLTGRLPFTGPTPMAMMLAHIRQPVMPPSQAAPGAGISPVLDGVVLQAMAKAPADRFRTAQAMSQALAGQARAGTSSTATEPIGGPGATRTTRVQPARASQPATAAAPLPVAQPAMPPRRRSSFVPAMLIALVLLAAIAGAGYVLARNLTGGDGGHANLPAVVTATATQTNALTTTTPAGIVQRSTQPALAETQAVIVPLDPTNTPELATSTPTETPVPTQTPSPTATPAPTDTPVPTTGPTQPPIGPADGQSTGQNLIVPASGATNAADAAQQAPSHIARADVAPSDWQGVPLGSAGGEQVAMISGDGSGTSVAALHFRLNGTRATGELTLSLRGVAVGSGPGVPMQMQVNGASVFREDAPFPTTTTSKPTFGDVVFHIPAANLVDGENTLEIANAGAGGEGEPPFIALSSGTLEMRLSGADGTIEIIPPPAQSADSAKIKPTKKPKSNKGNGNGKGNDQGNGNAKDGT